MKQQINTDLLVCFDHLTLCFTQCLLSWRPALCCHEGTGADGWWTVMGVGVSYRLMSVPPTLQSGLWPLLRSRWTEVLVEALKSHMLSATTVSLSITIAPSSAASPGLWLHSGGFWCYCCALVFLWCPALTPLILLLLCLQSLLWIYEAARNTSLCRQNISLVYCLLVSGPLDPGPWF